MEYTELPKPVPASEALKGASISIEVPNGAVDTFGPFERKYAEGFRIAKISSFKDLQMLGFVHADVREEHVVQAIRADERTYRDLLVRARQSPIRRAGESQEARCTCGSPHNEENVLPRRHVQNHLIDVLQPLVGDTLTSIHPLVIHTYHNAKNWLTRPAPVLVGIFLLEDITIGDHAVLTATPSVRGLYARNITIGKEGRLCFTGGSVKVRCNMLSGPSSLASHIFVPGLTEEFTRRVRP